MLYRFLGATAGGRAVAPELTDSKPSHPSVGKRVLESVPGHERLLEAAFGHLDYRFEAGDCVVGRHTG
ncbi:hypothetical protein SAMN05443661_101225 [Natronobacterium gregoryi]|uniref:Uncharacterized protein n=2 Tax=Natronobacterium gregoryi TaxID=44930 RepID=L0AKL0_NATGS|nr:hypothetical protein Natgr_3206 [Natronobacterium gregoryi SP2]ELY63432.1 hypothetical protein C490_16169 [Natronobacterium gregoryi SP2]PLK22154.1 hypothetical protein CYV19_00305 [Natronobacterium gregoryi SP2]SFI53975.1 hypothetical protein SAMN05443661_101225 [Natronobacterium gregoryi]